MKATLVCPLYKPNTKLLNNLKNKLNKQDVKGVFLQKVFVDGRDGLARHIIEG